MAKGKKKLGFKGNLLLVFLLITAMIFHSTSLLLFIGMLPSLVLLITGTRKGPRASTVAAMNLAGCIPFVFKLWGGSNDFEMSVDIVTDSAYISVMYMSAAFGYMIDWVVTGLVCSFMYQKASARMKSIKKRQGILIEKWGQGVTRAAKMHKKG